MLRWFTYDHLPGDLQIISRPFHDLATYVVAGVPRSDMRTAGLRKLLEAKDCVVRAALVREDG